MQTRKLKKKLIEKQKKKLNDKLRKIASVQKKKLQLVLHPISLHHPQRSFQRSKILLRKKSKRKCHVETTRKQQVVQVVQGVQEVQV